MNKTPLFALAAFAIAGLLFFYSDKGTPVKTNIDLTNAVETVVESGTTAMTVGEDILLEDIAPSAGDDAGIMAEDVTADESDMTEEETLTEDETVTEEDGDMTEGDEGSDAEDLDAEETEAEHVH